MTTVWIPQVAFKNPGQEFLAEINMRALRGDRGFLVLKMLVLWHETFIKQQWVTVLWNTNRYLKSREDEEEL